MRVNLFWILILTSAMALAAHATKSEVDPNMLTTPMTAEEKNKLAQFWIKLQKAVSRDDISALDRLSAHPYRFRYDPATRKAILNTTMNHVEKKADLKSTPLGNNPDYMDAWNRFAEVRPIYLFPVVWRASRPDLKYTTEGGITLFIGEYEGGLKVLLDKEQPLTRVR